MGRSRDLADGTLSELNVDSNTLAVDATNNRVGVGTASPAVTFDVSGYARTSTGILFGTDTAAANALDDYEEGTWTATLIGTTTNPSSSITETCFYTKIGNLVYVNGQFNNVNTTGASGGVRISGIPFPPNPGNQATGNVMDNLTGTWAGTNTANISPYFFSTQIAFYASQSAGGWFEITHNPGTGRYLSFSGTYKV